MNHSRKQFRINIGFLLNQPAGTSRDIHFEFKEIELPPELKLFNFKGVAKFSATRQGILIQCELHTLAKYECVKCLEPYSHTLQTNFDELFAFKEEYTTESGLILSEDGFIDLEPLVWEYLQLEVPIRPLCSLSCKGLCVQCGENLNSTTCEHISSSTESIS
ncbi:MAG: DUF177 domain-containing protein [Anaerolineaceae bacterium]|nr:DUF177 domain-containing protein [Anaerolineaceae bacterium]